MLTLAHGGQRAACGPSCTARPRALRRTHVHVPQDCARLSSITGQGYRRRLPQRMTVLPSAGQARFR